MQQQNIEKAEADFDSAMEVDPENCDVFHHRGQVQCLLLVIFFLLQLRLLCVVNLVDAHLSFVGF